MTWRARKHAFQGVWVGQSMTDPDARPVLWRVVQTSRNLYIHWRYTSEDQEHPEHVWGYVSEDGLAFVLPNERIARSAGDAHLITSDGWVFARPGLAEMVINDVWQRER
jgi:hypothetical protein